GHDMEQQPPLAALRRLGYTGPDQIALFPPILLDAISADFVLACNPEDGNDLLAHYRRAVVLAGVARPGSSTSSPRPATAGQVRMSAA
ncbi:MAG: hypothetical protein ACUVXG_13490, partial [Anaerolineae bacterium]